MSGRFPGFNRSPLGAALVIAGVLLLFYWKNLIGVPFEQKFFWEDFIYQNYPYRAFHAEQIADGTFPFWNPFQFGGMPFFADVQTAALYPPNWLLVPFAFDGTLEARWVMWLEVLHAFLGGLFLFLLVRNRTACAYAGLFAGLAYALSGIFVVRMIHANFLAVLAWAPLAWLFLIQAIERRSYTAALLGGLTVGIAMLGGAPQYSLYLLFVLGFTSLFYMVRDRGNGSSALVFPALSLALIVIFAATLFGVQYLPTTELAELSMRSDMTYEKSIECSMEPANLGTLFIPKLFGSAAGWNNRGYVGPGAYFYAWELASYVGVLPLLLACIPIAYRFRTPWVLFLSGLLIFGVLLALGGYGPLHPLLYKLLPVYDKFRCPGRAILIANWAILLLAGIGAQMLTKAPPDGRGSGSTKPRARAKSQKQKVPAALLAGLGAVLLLGIAFFLAGRPIVAASGKPEAIAGALRGFGIFLAVTAAGSAMIFTWARSRGPLAFPLRAALLAVLVAELFAYGFGFNDGKVDPKVFYRMGDETVEAIRAEVTHDYRVKTRAPEGLLFPRNLGVMQRLRGVDGYNQLLLERFNTIHNDDSVPFLRRMNLLGVKLYTEFDPSLRRLTLARNENAFPIARLFGDVRAAGAKADVLRELGAPGFDEARTLLIEGTETEPSRIDPAAKAEVVQWGENRIEIRTESSEPSYLFVSEIAFPGWRAEVDGTPAEVVIADYAFRSVPLPAGVHTVIWTYMPNGFVAGVTVALVAVGLALLYMLLVGPRRNDSLPTAMRALWGSES